VPRLIRFSYFSVLGRPNGRILDIRLSAGSHFRSTPSYHFPIGRFVRSPQPLLGPSRNASDKWYSRRFAGAPAYRESHRPATAKTWDIRRHGGLECGFNNAISSDGDASRRSPILWSRRRGKFSGPSVDRMVFKIIITMQVYLLRYASNRVWYVVRDVELVATSRISRTIAACERLLAMSDLNRVDREEERGMLGEDFNGCSIVEFCVGGGGIKA